ncbi:ACP S-malonyltransferase [Heliorestis acidaminivorans]|uniref:Malonyl CoA-acyl carrier protein transacylase n=1 Tax=Heliorestis acidaminivorans TaxID=553427 RepID=A0A6I0F0H2_9FIRM|nr:ACP S-malonyltransferase [Heliorestis acidaminivorans]KAB2954446.1 ACP S-malonyltransferase [Heliorestis acidaminivorans]
MEKIAFLFPGQGSQFVGMGADLYEQFPEAKKIYDEADEALGFSLSRLCFEGPEEELRLTINTQPALLVTSIALYKIVSQRGLQPHWVAGHSLGEYSALVAAGSLKLAEAVQLVRQRGTFMQSAVPAGQGTMAAILGLEGSLVEEACQEALELGIVEPANYNGAGQVVIAGEVKAVEKAAEHAKAKGAKKVVMLNVSAPFHCSLMEKAAREMAEVLRKAELKDPAIPIVANVTGTASYKADEIRNNLIKQVDHSVRWEQSMNFLAQEGVTDFYEIGPGKVLSGLAKKIIKGSKVISISDVSSLEKIVASSGESG